MKNSAMLGIGLVLAATVAVQAAGLKSGPQVGQRMGTYTTKKCNDAFDGVRNGQRLCYT